MKNKKIVKTGGKLYIAGEYAILHPGASALIQFIPMFMQAEISPSAEYQLSSDMFAEEVDLTPHSDYALIQETIQLMHQWLTVKGEQPTPFRLRITGKFERNGKKFGIGSSGSVVLLTLKALEAFYEVDLTADQLFRLAALVLIQRGDNGSMGDLACIAYEDLVYYQSFDRRKIAELAQEVPLLELLEQDWGYVIEKLQPQLSYDFIVGWTQEPAISKDMVHMAQSRITEHFLAETGKAVTGARRALEIADKELLKDSLQLASDQLESLSDRIYIDKLQLLKVATKGLDVIAKSSGAGGGDCGIAFSLNRADSQLLQERWQEAGIIVLYQERRGWDE